MGHKEFDNAFNGNPERDEENTDIDHLQEHIMAGTQPQITATAGPKLNSALFNLTISNGLKYRS